MTVKFSIVATLYQSAAYIPEFCHRASAVAQKLAGDDYEIILVNDGSPDNSLDIAVELTEKDRHVAVIDLSRNFGHHKAMMAGLSYTKGEKVFLIDIDLEEDPEWAISFSEKMEDKQCDVVYGKQEQRKGGFIERWSGQMFWWLINILSGMSIPNNPATARLMTRKYVDALLCFKEREIFMAGLLHIAGFYQYPYPINKHCTSKTTYNFKRKISLLVNSITSFSSVPLITIFYFGITILFFSIIYIGYLVANWMFLSKPLTGWTSIMASTWFLGGMIISFIGVVGIYLSRVFSETKQRPYVIVRNYITCTDKE